jgi:hypothetical protein
MVYLSIQRDGKTVESVSIIWSRRCVESILPKREPDVERDGVRSWKIAIDKRRLMGEYILRTVEGLNARGGGYYGEEFACFWGLVGIGKRWADDSEVEWWLEERNE